MEDKVAIELSKDEALVLIDFLFRFNEKEHKDIIEDQAEQRVLWGLESMLEVILVEPFMSNYKELVKQARDRIRLKE